MARDSELHVSVYVEWKISNFFDLPMEIDYVLNSPSFSLSNEKWFIRLHPNGETKHNSNGYVGLYVCKEKCTRISDVEFRIGMKRTDGTELQSIEDKATFGITNCGWGYCKFIERSAFKNLKDPTVQNTGESNATLTIFCNVRIADKSMEPSKTESGIQTLSPAATTVEDSSQTSSDGVTALIENFKDLYLSKRCADIRMIVKGKEFRGHRNVLTARSTVFSAMLTSDMAEKSSGIIEISDCDPLSFEDFLLFLYTGDLQVVCISNAASLYATAEKYDLKDLKEECVRCMISKLNVDSFCDVIHLAALYNEADVLMAATNYFLENAKDILVTLKWQNLSAENPSLGNELFLKYVSKK